MAKYPIIGEVKTRLGEEIGYLEASDLYKCFLKDTVEKVKGLETPFFIYFTPGEKETEFRDLLGVEHKYVPQLGNDLGERLLNGFKISSKLGYWSAIALASDIPDIPLQYLKDAVKKLVSVESVLGPSSDGGYYLIGLTRDVVSPELFEGINWSTETVYDETVVVINRLGLTFSPVDTWDDVDTESDLPRLTESTDPLFHETHTWRYLKTLKRSS